MLDQTEFETFPGHIEKQGRVYRIGQAHRTMATRGDAGDLQARGIGNRVDSFYFPPRHRDRLDHEAIGGPLNDREIDHRIFCVDRQVPVRPRFGPFPEVRPDHPWEVQAA